MDDEGSLVTAVSVIKAIRRGCKAELDAGRSLLGTDAEFPGALIEMSPDMRRFVLKWRAKKAPGLLDGYEKFRPRRSIEMQNLICIETTH